MSQGKVKEFCENEDDGTSISLNEGPLGPSNGASSPRDSSMFEQYPAEDGIVQRPRAAVVEATEAKVDSPEAKPPVRGENAQHLDPVPYPEERKPSDHGLNNLNGSLAADPDDVMRTRGVSLFQGGSSLPPDGQSSQTLSTPTKTSRSSGLAITSGNNSIVGSKTEVVERRTIQMEFGDEYTGEVTKLRGSEFYVPNGQGTLHSVTGGHSYVGEFKLRLRDGLGKLVTNEYFLWCRWKDNRPDWSASVRIDYTNGEKFSGYLAAVTDPQLQAKVRKDKTPLSKFSQWVQTTVLIRERWGEIVFPNGSRYFGQWEQNQPDGFGCALLENGDRYIGNWWKGKYHGAGTLFSSKKSKRLTGGGLVYDGIWEKGVFDAEEGHVTFPDRTRLTGEWKNSVQAELASVYHATKQDSSRRWMNTFQWETLLCGAQESAKTRDINAAVPLKCLIQKATSREEVETLCKRLIKENQTIGNSLKIFRRCFYFLYGTCGVSSEIGAGLGNNKLGWCHVRGQYGGCIHRGRGKVITSADVDAALGDVSSFVGSLRRWIDELVGDSGSEVIYDLEADVPVTRHLLDIVLSDVHQPLFNLYIQTYRKEQVGLTAALNRLSNITPDDLGVIFGRQMNEERLFSPYEDAIRSLQGLTKAFSLNGKLNCLKKMSTDIDISTRLGQMKLGGDELSRLSNFIQGRRASTGESLHAMSSPREGSDDDVAMAPLITQALAVQSGSADDLLPIHQYVLMEANIPYLFSHVQMLIDLSADESFVDGTSQDAFCITTLHACTTILPQLYRNIRDEKKVITPLAVYEKRIEDSLAFDNDEALTAVLAWLPSVLAAMGTVAMPLTLNDGAQVVDIVTQEIAFNEDLATTESRKDQAIPITNIVPALKRDGSAAAAASRRGNNLSTRLRVEAVKRHRHSEDSAMIQRFIKQAVSVLRAADVSVYLTLQEATDTSPAKVVPIDVTKLSSGVLKIVPEYLGSEEGRLILMASRLFVAPPAASSSICVELAHFMTKHNH